MPENLDGLDIFDDLDLDKYDSNGSSKYRIFFKMYSKIPSRIKFLSNFIFATKINIKKNYADSFDCLILKVYLINFFY